jgi:hypothetical protein
LRLLTRAPRTSMASCVIRKSLPPRIVEFQAKQQTTHHNAIAPVKKSAQGFRAFKDMANAFCEIKSINKLL